MDSNEKPPSTLYSLSAVPVKATYKTRIEIGRFHTEAGADAHAARLKASHWTEIEIVAIPNGAAP